MASGPDNDFYNLVASYRSEAARWIAHDANPVWEYSHIMLMANISRLLIDDTNSSLDKGRAFLRTQPHPGDPTLSAWKQFIDWAGPELTKLRSQQDVYELRGEALKERLSQAEQQEAESILSRDFEAMKNRVSDVLRQRIEELRHRH